MTKDKTVTMEKFRLGLFSLNDSLDELPVVEFSSSFLIL